MKKKSVAAVILMSFLMFSQSYAAPVCEYFDDIGFVYISGNAGSENANKTVSLMVKEKDNDPPDNDSMIYIADFKTDENGDYVYKFKINLGGQPGDYYIHTNIGGEISEKTELIKGEWLAVYSPVYDRDNNTISFHGLYKYESDNKDLRIKIKSGKLDSATDWDTDILYESGIPVNEENGLFRINISLAENNLTPGDYSFKIYDDTTACKKESEFEIFDINSVLNNINTYIKNKDASGLMEYTIGKLDILGLEDWEITQGVKVKDLTAGVFNLLINNNEDNIADIKELQTELKRAYATSLINNLTADDYDKAVDILFVSYKDIFDIEQFSYYQQYKNLSENNKKIALRKLYEKKEAFDSFGNCLDALSEGVLLTAINATEFWNQIQDIVTSNNDYFTVENIPIQVWKDISAKKPFESILEFEKECNDLKDKYNKASTKPSGGSGGSSGGSGMVITGRQTTVANENPPANFTESNNSSHNDNNEGNKNGITFTDVPKEHWAFDAVEYLYKNQIVNGVGNDLFLPDATLKREELIKMLVTAMGSAPVENEASFTDVDTSEWYAPYIAAAKNNGITYGKDDGSFGVGEALTREDAATLCYRALNYNTSEAEDNLNFDDKELISDYARAAVANMARLGIINGKGDGKFAPKAHCTRAEAAKIIFGILATVSK